MSKRRKSSQPTPKPAYEQFAVRWHNIANPGTPSVDIMSSPDPLNDETTFLAPPSSQRTTRSNRSTRFASIGRGVSPRKQQFELEVGDNRSPQRLLVTVETEDEDAPTAGTRRRLFPSSSPFKNGAGMAATTTTVPLKESIEDEFGDGSAATPKKRGRPRKTNGTPIPSAAKKRRAPTPLQRSTKRANTGRDITSSLEPSQPTPTPKRRGRPPKNSVESASDAGSHLQPTPEVMQLGTPTPKRRGRPPKNRSVEPSSDLGTVSQRTSTTKGRRRRQALAPEDLETMAEEPVPEPIIEQPDANDDDAMDLVGAKVKSDEDPNAATSPPRDHDSDIWMATMSEQATPRAATRHSRPEPEASPIPGIALTAPPASDDTESAASLGEGFAEDASSVRDAGSIMDGPYHSASRRNDTVAQEDFSMIFMDSIQSYQELRSSRQGPQPGREETGEGTGHINNSTLESLRQDAVVEDHDAQEAEPAPEDIVTENPAENAEGDFEELNNNLYDAEIDEVDLPEIPEVRVLPEDVGQDEGHHSRVPETAGHHDREHDEEPRMSEESMALHSDASAHDTDVGQDDIDIVQHGAAEETGWTQREEVRADEIMEEQSVPELDEARGSSSSPRQAEEPVEPDANEVIQTSSPVRSAGLSSKFGASPWLSRTPRRPNVSPLRRLVLSSVAKGDGTQRLSQKYRDSPLRDSPLRAAAASSQKEDSPRIAQDESNMYEDSFSEIPEAILTAATPARTAPIRLNQALEQEGKEQQEDASSATLAQHRTAPARLSQPLEEDEEQGDTHDAAQDQHVPESEGDPEVEQYEYERMDVAELDRVQEGQVAGVNEEQQQQQPLGYASVIQDQPPAPSNASSLAATDNGRLPTPDDTPPNIDMEDDQPDKSAQASMASPTPDPQAQLASEQAAAPSSASRSSASQVPRISVERASAAPEITPLNQMSSPVQEHPSSASHTSPGKVARPALSAIVRAGRVLQNVTSDPPSPGDRQNQLGSPFRSSVTRESWSGSKEPVSRRPSASPGRRSTSHQRQSASIDRLNDDPFASRPNIPRTGSFLRTLDRDTRNTASKERNSNPGSVAGSATSKPQHEEMRWLPDTEPKEPESASDHSHQKVVQSSPSRQAANSARSDTERSDAPADRDDETDIWELEAQRDDPESSRKETSFLSMTSAPLHRRPAIPSPWQRKSEFTQGGTSQCAASKTSNSGPGANQAQPEDNDEGYSLLAQRQKAQAEDDGEGYSLLAQRQKAQEAGAAKQPESAAKPSGFDLSSFFSSPAAIGGRLAEKFFPSKTTKQDESEKAAAPVIPHSTMFPSAPLRQLDPSSEGPNVLSSPVRSQQFQPTQPSSERSEAESQHQPIAGQTEATEEAVAEELQPPSDKNTLNTSASPSTPERLQRPVTSQMKDFTPRPRQTNQSSFQPSSARSAALTPPRMQLSHEDIERWQQETSNPSDDEGDSPRRLLRPLPPRNASPSKSAIRSPLKPHTPGRVVEFTSSVLSPLEQARQRQQRHAIQYVEEEEEEEDDEEVSQPTPRSGVDKENDEEDIVMDHRPEAAQIKANELSRTAWSRNHWLFLDRLLQHRKKQRFGIDCEPRSQRFLGKTVRANGESLKLEQWHLDCVDAFKALVGGWEEDALCKRLFSLIKSEQRRARQLASGDVEMFH